MYAFFPIVCSFGVCNLFIISIFFNASYTWDLLMIFLLFCFSLSLLATLEASLWCSLGETMTGAWYKLFVSGELMLFLTLMVPLVYVADDFGDEAISDPLGVPLLGVYVLLLSSFCVSNFEADLEAHEANALTNFNYKLALSWSTKVWLLLTIVNGLGFVVLQITEFNLCTASVLNTSWYSTCLVLVSFHGFHVVAGVILLIWTYMRIFAENNYYSLENYLTQYRLAYFTCFYWHFVDFIWLIVYTLVYYIP